MKIKLNGRPVEVEDSFSSYRQLCELAGESPGASMTYSSRYGSGILADGEDLLLDESMVINVVNTGNA